MTLKAQMVADLPTFINVDEFGDLRSLDGGGQVRTILDDEKGEHTSEGVYVTESVLYVRSSDFTAPVVDQRVTIDGKVATVVHVDETEGMLTIRFRWWES